MLRSLKVATPATAVTDFVPDSVPPAGFVPIATVTLPVNPVATLPRTSFAVTCTAGVIWAPAVVVPGCTVNTSWVAPPAVTSNATLVAPVSADAAAVSVYPLPILSMLNELKVATPAAADTDVVPARFPLPGLFPIATVTMPENPVAVLSRASWAVTTTAGVMIAPAPVDTGCTENTRWVAAPETMLNALLLLLRLPDVAASRYPVPILSM